MMKLMIINPDYGMTDEEINLRLKILKKYVAPDTELAMVCPKKSRVEINSAIDVVFAGAEILELAAKAESDGFDAVILYCFSDPVIDACREALKIPVIGAAQASCLAALQISRSFSVILAESARIPEKKIFLRTLGIDSSRIGEISAIDLHGISVWKNRDEVLNRLTICAKEMAKKNKIEAIILGCLSMLGVAEDLSKILKIPVIDPAVCAVASAESLVRQKLSTSKISYPMMSSVKFF